MANFAELLAQSNNAEKKNFDFKDFIELQKNAANIKTKIGFDVSKFSTMKELRKGFRAIFENKSNIDILQKQSAKDILQNFGTVVKNPEKIIRDLNIKESAK